MTPKSVLGLVTAGLIGLFALTVAGGSYYTVDEGERGVILRNGAVTGTASPGLGFKIPFVDTVREIDVRSQSTAYDRMPAYSKDQQAADLRVSVNWRPNVAEAEGIYSRYQTVNNMFVRLVQPRVFEIIKTVFGGYTAVSAIQDRGKLNADVRAAIMASVDGPVIIESVQIENIDFSDAYEESIEKRMQAEVEVQRLKQNADREKVQAEITVTQAIATADSKKKAADAQAYQTLEIAKAEAQGTRLRGEADAAAITAKTNALKENAALVSLTQAERWDGKLPTTMVPGGATPFISVK